MDTNDKTENKLTAKDVAAFVVVAGVVTVSCITAGKIAAELTDYAVDAVVNTLTLARKRKPATVVHNVTDVA